MARRAFELEVDIIEFEERPVIRVKQVVGEELDQILLSPDQVELLSRWLQEAKAEIETPGPTA